MKHTLVATLCCALALAGCASGKEFIKLSQEYAAQNGALSESLLAKNKALTERAAKLPAEQQGLADVQARLAANQTELAAIDSALNGSPAQIDAAVKEGEAEKAKSLYDAQQAALTTRLPAATTELTGLEAAVAELETKAAEAAAKAAAEAEAAAKAAEAAKYFTKELSSGVKVVGNATGIEAQLVAFIEDASRPVDKTTWFNFDRLTFKTGAAELDLEKSQDQLKNIAEILKAYPKVKIKVGGYTDNAGKPAANLKLSTARAKSVTLQLIALGVAKARLSPEGYGDKHPECPANDTDECREKNRRIAVRVSAK